ncbi:hypothetical protein [Actinomadura violacea]|uniref:Uncharacterized protein n=1 Tax=Actinomadura violacea TaxID=2819934 RepID=A0ABS3S9P5_9ACTN|nr:hypothetical protein [Actinomadura violacea]MBO2464949.1 hypothetical protein [Actinomadura violacea]
MTLAEKAAASLRLEGPGLGYGLDDTEVDRFLAATDAGLIVLDTACDKGMQDNYALRHDAKTSLPATT